MSLLDQIEARFDVARRMGDEILVHCPDPDHEDSKPSCCINVVKRVWFCYSCCKGGRVETLLGGRVADETTDELLSGLTSDLAALDAGPRTYPEGWLDQFEVGPVHPYWLSRGLSEETCRRFRLGYDFTTDRVTYPLRDPAGTVLGVAKRATKPLAIPKYLEPPEVAKSETMFAYHLLRGGVRDVVVTEGALDAIAMWDVGVPGVAQFGASLSQTQVGLLRRLGPASITLAYDRDEAGRRAEQRALNDPSLDFCPIRVMRWDPRRGKDPMALDPEVRRAAYDHAEVSGLG